MDGCVLNGTIVKNVDFRPRSSGDQFPATAWAVTEHWETLLCLSVVSLMKDVNVPEDDLGPPLSTSRVLGSQACAITYDLGGGGVKLSFLWLLANINYIQITDGYFSF